MVTEIHKHIEEILASSTPSPSEREFLQAEKKRFAKFLPKEQSPEEILRQSMLNFTTGKKVYLQGLVDSPTHDQDIEGIYGVNPNEPLEVQIERVDRLREEVEQGNYGGVVHEIAGNIAVVREKQHEWQTQLAQLEGDLEGDERYQELLREGALCLDLAVVAPSQEARFWVFDKLIPLSTEMNTRAQPRIRIQGLVRIASGMLTYLTELQGLAPQQLSFLTQISDPHILQSKS